MQQHRFKFLVFYSYVHIHRKRASARTANMVVGSDRLLSFFGCFSFLFISVSRCILMYVHVHVYLNVSLFSLTI